jgi:hypothetical protein
VRALLTLSRRLAIEKSSAGSCWLQRGGHSRCMSLSVWRRVATRYDKLAANYPAFTRSPAFPISIGAGISARERPRKSLHEGRSQSGFRLRLGAPCLDVIQDTPDARRPRPAPWHPRTKRRCPSRSGRATLHRRELPSCLPLPPFRLIRRQHKGRKLIARTRACSACSALDISFRRVQRGAVLRIGLTGGRIDPSAPHQLEHCDSKWRTRPGASFGAR